MVSSTIPRQACALAVTTAPATSSYNDPSPRPRPPGIEPQPPSNKCEHVTSEPWQTPNPGKKFLLIGQTCSDQSIVIKIISYAQAC